MIHKTTERKNEIALPAVLVGFEHINRHWDSKQGVYVARILPGQFYVSKSNEMISTVLGSCVSACIRDPRNGVGGMNHFMLPMHGADVHGESYDLTDAARYGNWAMEYLINEVLKNGGERRNLEVKLFGGARVLRGMTQMDVGNQNIDFVHRYLDQENIHAVVEDLGGTCPRKVLYFPDSGSVKVKKMKATSDNSVYQQEIEYAKRINDKPTQGAIELF